MRAWKKISRILFFFRNNFLFFVFSTRRINIFFADLHLLKMCKYFIWVIWVITSNSNKTGQIFIYTFKNVFEFIMNSAMNGICFLFISYSLKILLFDLMYLGFFFYFSWWIHATCFFFDRVNYHLLCGFEIWFPWTLL